MKTALASLPEGHGTKEARLLSQPRPDLGRRCLLFVTVIVMVMIVVIITTTDTIAIIIAAMVVIGDDDDVVGGCARIGCREQHASA